MAESVVGCPEASSGEKERLRAIRDAIRPVDVGRGRGVKDGLDFGPGDVDGVLGDGDCSKNDVGWGGIGGQVRRVGERGHTDGGVPGGIAGGPDQRHCCIRTGERWGEEGEEGEKEYQWQRQRQCHCCDGLCR